MSGGVNSNSESPMAGIRCFLLYVNKTTVPTRLRSAECDRFSDYIRLARPCKLSVLLPARLEQPVLPAVELRYGFNIVVVAVDQRHICERIAAGGSMQQNGFMVRLVPGGIILCK